MMRFKTEREGREFLQLKPRLKIIMTLLEQFFTVEFKKDILVTGCFRTQDEQDAIYKDNQKYQEKPWQSVHQFWRGCDVRVIDWTPKERDRTLMYLNSFTYDDTRPEMKTAIIHDVGAGNHLHVQVS